MIDAVGDFLDVDVAWHDATPHGSLLTTRLHDTVRQVLYPACWRRLSAEMEKPAPLRRRFAADEMSRLARTDRASDAHRQVVDDARFWRHDPALVRLDGFSIRSEEGGSCTTLAAADPNAVREWLRTGVSENAALVDLARSTQRRLAAAAVRRTPLPIDAHPVSIGHGCVSWSDGESRLWTDPFLRPKRLRYPSGQQPFSPLDASEPKHIVLITHGHPDHFSPASLLLFPLDTTLIVPRVDDESPLSFDMARRARELGFADVRALAWGETFAAGAFRITAWPFFGEQPLGDHARGAGQRDRNRGATYHVTGPGGLAAWFLADAGADPAGSTLVAARRMRRECGRVDLVFGNQRKWRIFPPQFIVSSVPQYLCYVPDEELGVPQTLMLTPDQLAEIGEVLAAQYVVPYAMGGAPWFAEIGLGLGDPLAGEGGAFDAPLAATTEDDPDTLIRAASQAVVLAPGDRIGPAGPTRHGDSALPDGARLLAPSPLPPPARCALALGGCHAPGVVADLLALTRIDPAAYLVAAPGFIEIGTRDALAAPFLFELVMRLVPGPLWSHASPTPLTAGLFDEEPTWRARFESGQVRVTQALRESGDELAALRPLVRELQSQTARPAVRTVAADLLHIDLDAEGPWPAPSDVPSSAAPIRLPPQAAGLEARHGLVATATALLLVKLVHNAHLTLAVSGRRRWEEAEFFARLLADARVE